MVVVEAKALAVSKANNDRRNGDIRCKFYEKKGHKKDNYQKKHLEKRPTRFKHQDFTDQAFINCTNDESIPKGKRKEGKYFGAVVFV